MSTVNRDEAADILRVKPSAVASTLSRHHCTENDCPGHVYPLNREAGRGGQNIYNRAKVVHVAANRVGTGNWTRTKEETRD